MSKGVEFEKRALGFLEYLFELLGFSVIKKRRQKAGNQFGFDIIIEFFDESGRMRKFYFECKDYSTDINWNKITEKVLDLSASSHRPDGFIAISPRKDFSNKQENAVQNLEEKVGFPIKSWTPESKVEDFFSLDEHLYKYVYGKILEVSEEEKVLIRQKIKDLINDMLRQKDELAEKQVPVTLPKELTLKLPRIDKGDIIGRTDELQELHQLLFSYEKVVVVNGLGGIGKTTLAQGYLSKYYNDYQHIVWVSQLTKDIVSDITSTEGLAENLTISREGKETGQLFNEIISRLKTMPGSPNLLILDNVEEELAKLKDYLPGQPNWHVLTTSRKKIEGFHAMGLDFLSAEKAIALFKKHCSRITSDDQIADLVKTIDYHTLTIEIIAKTAQRHRTDIETLKKAIKDDLRSNVYIPHKGTGEKIDSVRSYLISIFKVSGLTEDETWLMKQFTCLPAEYHPYERLLELIDPDETKKEVFAETCNNLVEQGWLLCNAKTEAYKMHLVVQEVLVRQLLPGLKDVERLLDKNIRNLYIDQTKDNPVDKFKWVTFGNALLNNFPNDISAKIAHLQNNLAIVLQDLGDYVGARVLHEKAMHSAELNFGIDHPNTATSYSNLAIVLQDLGDYAGARVLLEKAVRSYEQNFGPNHPTTAVSYSNLAAVLKYLSDYAGASVLLEKAVRSYEQNFGPEHPSTTICYSNLATVLQDLGDYTGARELMEKVVRSDEQSFGTNHPNTSIGYSILGLILKYLGDYAEARVLLEKALRLAEQHFGPDHPTTAVRYSNLALVLQDLGDYTKARELLEKALYSNEQNLGLDHPNTAASYSNLAIVLQDLGDYVGARLLLEKAMYSAELNFGIDHPTTAVSYSNLATVLQYQGEYTGALDLAQKSLSIFKKALPENHPYISQAQSVYDSIKASL